MNGKFPPEKKHFFPITYKMKRIIGNHSKLKPRLFIHCLIDKEIFHQGGEQNTIGKSK